MPERAAPSPSHEDSERVRQGLNRAVLAQHLSELIATREINCVLDVGAHRGEYGRILRGIGYRGTIVSFEPVSSAFAELERAMEAEPPWAGHRLALGEASREVEMTVFEDTSFSALVEPTAWAREAFEGLRDAGRELVAMRRLDDLYGKLVEEITDPRVLLKIDVQGSEWQVLDGAPETLREVRAVQIEAAVMPVYEGVRPYHELIERLGKVGLRLSGLFPVSRDRDLRIVELDCFLVRPASGR